MARAPLGGTAFRFLAVVVGRYVAPTRPAVLNRATGLTADHALIRRAQEVVRSVIRLRSEFSSGKVRANAGIVVKRRECVMVVEIAVRTAIAALMAPVSVTRRRTGAVQRAVEKAPRVTSRPVRVSVPAISAVVRAAVQRTGVSMGSIVAR